MKAQVVDRGDQDVLADPTRARLFKLLAEMRRPATSEELSRLTGRHANTVRVQLRRLADAGLIERTSLREGPGRPRHVWVVAPGREPAGLPPEHSGHLGRWLARTLGTEATSLADVERSGTDIGRELAAASDAHGVKAAMSEMLGRMGFQPRDEALAGDGLRFVLGHCPYRQAVQENQPVVCMLHRGITRGLLEHLDPNAALTGFVAKDPVSAGCLIDIAVPSG
jgi:predicted ArsR family transcriptional regulator